MQGIIKDDSVAGTAPARYPALAQLCTAYLHQDWRDEHDDSAAAVRSFVRESRADLVTDAAHDIDRLLAAGYDNATLARVLIDGLECNDAAAIESGAASWLETVRASLRATG